MDKRAHSTHKVVTWANVLESTHAVVGLLQNNILDQIADTAFDGQVSSLVALTIHDNKITSLGNIFSEEFTSLQRIYLQNNDISTLTSASFQGLKQASLYYFDHRSPGVTD